VSYHDVAVDMADSVKISLRRLQLWAISLQRGLTRVLLRVSHGIRVLGLGMDIICISFPEVEGLLIPEFMRLVQGNIT
jgi:hypothetical protein